MEASEATEIFENDQNEKLIDEISDALHRLSLQKQTEEMIKKLVEQKDQTSGESKKSSTFDKLAILQQMQQEEMVVLKVGGMLCEIVFLTINLL